MVYTMEYLCKNIEGCVLGYTQSDEITLILCDYKNLNTGAWFDYNIQKLASVSSSLGTLAFNRFFQREMEIFQENNCHEGLWINDNKAKLALNYAKSYNKGLIFDS